MTVYFHILFLQELKIQAILYIFESPHHLEPWGHALLPGFGLLHRKNSEESFLGLVGNHSHCYLLIVYLNVFAIWLCGFTCILENTWFSRYLHICKTCGSIGVYMYNIYLITLYLCNLCTSLPLPPAMLNVLTIICLSTYFPLHLKHLREEGY